MPVPSRKPRTGPLESNGPTTMGPLWGLKDDPSVSHWDIALHPQTGVKTHIAMDHKPAHTVM